MTQNTIMGVSKSHCIWDSSWTKEEGKKTTHKHMKKRGNQINVVKLRSGREWSQSSVGASRNQSRQKSTAVQHSRAPCFCRHFLACVCVCVSFSNLLYLCWPTKEREEEKGGGGKRRKADLPRGQTHSKWVPLSLQAPPFKQGFGSQLSTRDSHRAPV